MIYLDQNVFTIRHDSAHVDDGTNNTPSVGKVQVHLVSELFWLVSRDTQNNVLASIFWIGTRNKRSLRPAQALATLRSG